MFPLIIIFLLSQLCLFLGIGVNYYLLNVRSLLLTPWSFVLGGWYYYLLVYYGPTSLHAVLATESGIGSSVASWYLNTSSFGLALLASFFQLLLPLFITKSLLLLFPIDSRLNISPWSRLAPLLIHRSTFIFGVLGTVVQIIVCFLYADSRFNFSMFNPFEKLITTMFLIFTFGPQIALILFQLLRADCSNNLPKFFSWITFSSLIISISVFSAFGMRTYSMTSSLLLLFSLCYQLRLRKTLLLTMIPTFLVISFAFATFTNRTKFDADFYRFPLHVFSSLQRDLSYRSGFGTDSVVIGARQCIVNTIGYENLPSIINNELILGLPAPLRSSMSPNLFANKLEVLVGDCYRNWLGIKNIRIDLLDTKAEYFLVVFGPLWGGFFATLFWLGLELGLTMFISYLFTVGVKNVAFMLPAFAQVVIFASTPGEFFVYLKAALPLFFMILVVSEFFLNRFFIFPKR